MVPRRMARGPLPGSSWSAFSTAARSADFAPGAASSAFASSTSFFRIAWSSVNVDWFVKGGLSVSWTITCSILSLASGL